MDKVQEDETKPYEYKYQARNILKTLQVQIVVSRQADHKLKESKIFSLADAILDFKVGVNFFDCEEFFDAE